MKHKQNGYAHQNGDGCSSPAIEEPQLQCRGLWIPIEVISKFEQNEISSTEVLLLAYIDGLVKAKGEGCWATNTFLAKKFNLTPKHIGDTINRLQKIGLLKQVGWKITRLGRFRLLETIWSRIPMIEGIKEKPDTPQPLRELPDYPLRKLPEPSLRKLPEHNNIERNIIDNCRIRDGEKLKTNQKSKLFANNTSPSPGRKLASSLYEGLAKARKIMRRPSLQKWGKVFDNLITQIMERDRLNKKKGEEYISQVLDFHLSHLKDTYHPKLYSAQSFQDNFHRIEDAIERNTHSDGRTVDKNETLGF